MAATRRLCISASEPSARPARGARTARRARRLSAQPVCPAGQPHPRHRRACWRRRCTSSSPARRSQSSAARRVAAHGRRAGHRRRGLRRDQAHDRRSVGARAGCRRRAAGPAGDALARRRSAPWRCSKPAASRPRPCACTGAAATSRAVAFAGYPDNGLSLFLEKRLGAMKLDDDDFTLFGLRERFALDCAQLDERWRELQAEVHPDRFAADGAAAQRVAMQWAVRVNEAYRRLKDPLKRARLPVRACAARRSTPSATPRCRRHFLLQQMAWREALDDADDEAAVAGPGRRGGAARSAAAAAAAACCSTSRAMRRQPRRRCAR